MTCFVRNDEIKLWNQNHQSLCYGYLISMLQYHFNPELYKIEIHSYQLPNIHRKGQAPSEIQRWSLWKPNHQMRKTVDLTAFKAFSDKEAATDISFGVCLIIILYSLWPGAISHWTKSIKIQAMACCLFDAKPLPEPILTYYQFYPWEQTSVKSKSKQKIFHWRKCIDTVVCKAAAILFRPHLCIWKNAMCELTLETSRLPITDSVYVRKVVLEEQKRYQLHIKYTSSNICHKTSLNNTSIYPQQPNLF